MEIIGRRKQSLKLGTNQVSINDNMKFSLYQTCRTCLKNDENSMNMIKIFENNVTNLTIHNLHVIDELTAMKLKIKHNDGLPQQICNECMDHLTNVKTFRIICEQSQIVLEKYFKTLSTVDTQEQDQQIPQPLTSFEFINIENVQYPNNFQHALIIKKENVLNTSNVVNHSNNNITDRELIKHENGRHTDTEISITHTIDIQKDSDLKKKKNNNNDDIMNKCKISNKKYISDLCGKSFKTIAALKFHIKRCKCTKKRVGCEDCGKDFKNLEILNKHKTNNKCFKRKTEPKCRYCKKNFDIDIKEHLRLNHPKKLPYKCSICGINFMRKENCDIHEKSHKENAPLECHICHKVFKSERGIMRHVRVLHTISKHTCQHCSLEFDNKYRFEYHLKQHNPDRKYKCNFCEKSFIQAHHLTDHELTHTRLRPYLCDICGRDFPVKTLLQEHLDKHNQIKRCVCKICKKAFSYRGGLLAHMKLHRSETLRFKCNKCEKDFKFQSMLFAHLNKHNENVLYKCKLCEKEFNSHLALKIHEKHKHSKEIYRFKSIKIKKKKPVPEHPFVCEICNRHFKFAASLDTHMKMHSDDRKYECEMCGSKFKRPTHLRLHIDGVHLKKKPYKCTECDKTFLQSGERTFHMRSHTGERPHICNYCGKGFIRIKDLRKHIMGVHKINVKK